MLEDLDFDLLVEDGRSERSKRDGGADKLQQLVPWTATPGRTGAGARHSNKRSSAQLSNTSWAEQDGLRV